MNTLRTTKNKQTNKYERLEARLNPELKLRLQHAADLQGSSLTEFLLRSAEKAANEVINEHQIIQLSAEDSRAFVHALFNPGKPKNILKKAFKRYKKEVSSQA